MNTSILSSILLFAFVSSITPGPNNLMLLSSGSRFGLKKTLPHLAGVNLGFGLLLFLVGLGLQKLFALAPMGFQALKALGSIYLVFLAYKIFRSSTRIDENSATDSPLNFRQAALFQWVNPKAWTMAITAISLFSQNSDFMSLLFLTFTFTLVNLGCISTWTILGVQIRDLLRIPWQQKAFNAVLALLLLGTVYPILMASL